MCNVECMTTNMRDLLAEPNLAPGSLVTSRSSARPAPPARPPTRSLWLTYAEAAPYTRGSVAHLRNLVSTG